MRGIHFDGFRYLPSVGLCHQGDHRQGDRFLELVLPLRILSANARSPMNTVVATGVIVVRIVAGAVIAIGVAIATVAATLVRVGTAGELIAVLVIAAAAAMVVIVAAATVVVATAAAAIATAIS